VKDKDKWGKRKRSAFNGEAVNKESVVTLSLQFVIFVSLSFLICLLSVFLYFYSYFMYFTCHVFECKLTGLLKTGKRQEKVLMLFLMQDVCQLVCLHGRPAPLSSR